MLENRLDKPDLAEVLLTSECDFSQSFLSEANAWEPIKSDSAKRWRKIMENGTS